MKVGPEEVVFNSPINNDPDAPFWTFENRQGNLTGIITDGLGPKKPSGTYFTKNGVNPLIKNLTLDKLELQKGLDGGPSGSFDEMGVWLKYIYLDDKGLYHGFYHGESFWIGGVESGQTIGYVEWDEKASK